MQPGTQLGHYEILSQLGKGGMGEVWRARDTKLGREVAIKTLPEEFAEDADRLARFEREAKLLASLNHSNIAAIYGLESQEGTRFLVLELVEGDTLADRLKRGGIPVEESLELGLQVAEALEAAHEKGVIHRDLKPANIKVTPDGKVKVLDFGLAKAFAADQGDVALSNSPTLSLQATKQGVILGTAAYMSPEQARGGMADQRADIWAFGCVLFEMLAGRPAFDGQTISDILAAVLKTEPDWRALPPATPARIRFLLERSLEKNRDDRTQRISEVRAEVRKVLAAPQGPRLREEADAGRRSAASWLPWVTTAILGIALAGLFVWRGPEPGSQSSQVVRFEHLLPEGTGFRDRGPAAPALAVTPDGEHFLYNGTGGFYIRSMDEFEARLIPDTEANLRTPVFSPDGEEIAYWNADTDELMKIPTGGGRATKLADLTGYPFGISWTEGTILYGQEDGIWGVPPGGGSARHLITTGPGEQAVGAQFLPGAREILYAVTDGDGDGRWNEAAIVVESLSTPGERHVVLERGSDPRYLPSGHLVYSFGNRLYAAALDLETLTVGEDRVEMIQGIDRTAGRAFYSGQAAYGISNNGTLIWTPESLGTSTEELVLTISDPEGQTDPLTEDRLAYRTARMSPVDDRVAVEIESSTDQEAVYHIYILEAGELRQLTFEGTVNRFPAWTPDGESLVYASNQGGGTLDIYRRPADFSGGAERVYTSPDPLWPSHVSVDDVLAFVEFPGGGTQGDIWTLDLNGGEPRIFVNTETHETSPWFSADGRAIAFQSASAEGEDRVWIRPFPGGVEGRQIVVPGEGTTSPVWFADRAELVYMRNDPVGLMSIGVETTPNLRFLGEAQTAGYSFNAVATSGGRLSPWAPASDRRIVTVGFPVAQGGARVKVELNWIEELRERVPVP